MREVRGQAMADARPVRPASALRALSSGEVWLALGSAVALAAGASLDPLGLPKLHICLFNHLTGWPCPGCGLTRSFCALSHGQFGAAWAYNPLGYAPFAAAFFFMLRPALRLWCPALDARMRNLRIPTWLPLAALVGLCAFGLWRVVGQG